jgi:RNA polymerase sigma-70 factor (ECF subfamily)
MSEHEDSITRSGQMKQNAFDCIEVTLEEASTSVRPRSVTQFEELAIPLVDSVYNLARWLAQSDHDAEDLVQETYLKALRSFRTFQVGTNFRAWLFRILRNTFLSSCKGLAAGSLVSLDSDEDGSDLAVENETPETILMKYVNSAQIQRAIDDLPNIYRETILLCDVEKLSYCEISAILSIPIGTVMSRLARGRKALRRSLQGTPRVSSQVNSPATATAPM